MLLVLGSCCLNYTSSKSYVSQAKAFCDERTLKISTLCTLGHFNGKYDESAAGGKLRDESIQSCLAPLQRHVYYLLMLLIFQVVRVKQ